MRTFVLWLLSWLEQSLDPELKARVDALHAKIAKIEADEKDAVEQEQKSNVAYAASLLRRQNLVIQSQELEAQIAQDEQSLKASQVRIEAIKNEAEIQKSALDGLSESDALRTKL